MNRLTDLKIQIDRARVSALLRADRAPVEGLDALIDREAAACLAMVRPEIVYALLPITRIGKDTVTFVNGVTLTGPRPPQALVGCDRAAVAVLTLGQAADDYIQAASADDMLRGFAADTLCVVALESLGRALWAALAQEAAASGAGLTPPVSPGDEGFPLEGQAPLFACLGGGLPVTLTSSCMMRPVKSLSQVYGLGKGFGIAPCGHACVACGLARCAYRVTDAIPVTVRGGAGEKTLLASPGETLLALLAANGLAVEAPCGGQGTCGKCMVTIRDGAPVPTEEDKRFLSAAQLARGVRLACRVRVSAPMTVELAAAPERFAVMTKGIGPAADLAPAVTKKYIPRERLAGGFTPEAVARAAGAEKIAAALCLPEIGEAGVTAVLFENRLVKVEIGDTTDWLYGVAVDIGTTTVVCTLVDLISGRTLGTEAAPNPQRAHGADVIARLAFAQRGGAPALREAITGGINRLIAGLCAAQGASPAQIRHTVVAGNPAMAHLFLGLDTAGLAAAPFTPALTGPAELTAGEAGLCTVGIVGVLPGVSGYVGGDITAGLLACGMAEGGGEALLIDLGTNGEMALRAGGRVTVCSVAAGPAFEGGNIACGMGGVPGAVSGVTYSPDGLALGTVDGEPARGICGSGLLDAVALLVRLGVVDKTGRMAAPGANVPLAERLEEADGARRFWISREPKIYLTQRDIRQVQLAKAAFSAGIALLTQAAGIAPEKIGRVCLAGGFGGYLNIRSAFEIGLLPRAFEGRVTAVGNTALGGAVGCLLSRPLWRRAARLAAGAKVLELAGSAAFQELLLAGMGF